MSGTLYAYKNVVDGQTYVFAAPRPDLEARPNFEKADLSDVPQYTIDAALREKAAADSIAAAGRTRESQQAVDGSQNDEPVVNGTNIGDHAAELGVFQTASTPEAARGVGGVLSRGRVVSPLTRTELVEKALADGEALVLHGTLADNVDGSQNRTGLGTGPVADVVNAPPVGDTKGAVAKRAARAAKTTKAAAPKPLVEDKSSDKSGSTTTGKGPSA